MLLATACAAFALAAAPDSTALAITGCAALLALTGLRTAYSYQDVPKLLGIVVIAVVSLVRVGFIYELAR